MNAIKVQLLLATNGEQSTQQGLDYGVWLAETLHLPSVLLGVVERPGRRKKIQALLANTARELEERGLASESLISEGNISKQIIQQTRAGKFITVVSPMGRPTWKRLIRGRSFRRLLADIPTPMFYVPVARMPIRNVLVCMGGLGYAQSMEHTILWLAKQTGAQMTLLNVIEPITFDYPTSRRAQEHVEDLVETDTPQGRNLRAALTEARAAGVTVDVKVRHGTVVHEIQEEIRAGDYELVGMGSPHSPQGLRHLYLPNVTAEVAEAIDRPVLTVRTGYDLKLHED